MSELAKQRFNAGQSAKLFFWRDNVGHEVHVVLAGGAQWPAAKRMVEQCVAIYNLERPHFSLQLKTPDEVHRASLAEVRQSANPAITGVNL